MLGPRPVHFVQHRKGRKAQPSAERDMHMAAMQKIQADKQVYAQGQQLTELVMLAASQSFIRREAIIAKKK
jgi:hypothetical protein